MIAQEDSRMKRKAVVLSAFIALAVTGVCFGVAAQTRADMERDYVRGVVYLVTTAGPAFEKPDPTSTRVGAVKPTLGLLVYQTTTGWVQVGLVENGESNTFPRGWIRGDPANLIKGDQLTVPMRTVKMKGKAWTAATQLAILRGQVRIGFTKEQVEIARGDAGGGEPRKESEETAAGVTETWTYPDAIYTFTGGRVSKIKKIE
jgi:hypothetical protein